MGENPRTNLKPAGDKVMVGAIPGAVILTNEMGEVIAIHPDAVEPVIQAIWDLLPFAKNTTRCSDSMRIPVPNWPASPKDNRRKGNVEK